MHSSYWQIMSKMMLVVKRRNALLTLFSVFNFKIQTGHFKVYLLQCVQLGTKIRSLHIITSQHMPTFKLLICKWLSQQYFFFFWKLNSLNQKRFDKQQYWIWSIENLKFSHFKASMELQAHNQIVKAWKSPW